MLPSDAYVHLFFSSSMNMLWKFILFFSRSCMINESCILFRVAFMSTGFVRYNAYLVEMQVIMRCII